MQNNVPPGVDYERVSRFFAENVPGADAALTFTMIGDGRSNLTYRVEGPAGTWVMRRPPLGHRLPTAHDMKREFTILSAISGTGVPVATPIALCEDEEVNEQPFYVMEYRPGTILAGAIPEGYASTEAERRAVGYALVDTLADLHAIDYRAVGLEEFGRPEGYLERQVRRWSQQWERSKTREVPEVDELIRRLNACIPASPPSTIVHGDYRLGNIALDPENPGRVVAIFDWEMSTLGDPLADLGYTLAFWMQQGDPPEANAAGDFTTLPGFPRRNELAARYAERSGTPVDDVDFYQVLALYKLGIILEGIYARYLQGATVGPGYDQMGVNALRHVRYALSLADQSANPRLRGEF